MFTLAGQLSVILITAMGWSNEVLGSFIPSLLVLAGLMVVSVLHALDDERIEDDAGSSAGSEAPLEVPA
jgi:hypothetical protein